MCMPHGPKSNRDSSEVADSPRAVGPGSCGSLLGSLPEGVRNLIDYLQRRFAQLDRENQLLRKAEDALRESERRYRLLAENVKDVIWTASLDMRFTYVTPSFELLLGKKPAEVVGQGVEGMMTPASAKLARQIVAEEIALAVQHFDGLTRSRTAELELVRRDGSTVWAEVKGSFLCDENGRPIGIVGSTRDITERRRAEQALRESEWRRAEAEKLAIAGRLAAQVAHEINNPLAGIKNSFLLVKEAIRRDAPEYEFVARIEREIDRIARIVQRMYGLYRPVVQPPTDVGFGAAVDEVVAMLEPKRREREVCVEVLIPAHLILRVPPDSMRQVLYNLIANAMEASPKEGVVKIEARLVENTTEISVSDEGPGIDEDAKGRVFEPFFSTKQGTSSGGLGLGLPISQTIVESLGGSLGFDSVVGKGTTFRVTLPR